MRIPRKSGTFAVNSNFGGGLSRPAIRRPSIPRHCASGLDAGRHGRSLDRIFRPAVLLARPVRRPPPLPQQPGHPAANPVAARFRRRRNPRERLLFHRELPASAARPAIRRVRSRRRRLQLRRGDRRAAAREKPRLFPAPCDGDQAAAQRGSRHETGADRRYQSLCLRAHRVHDDRLLPVVGQMAVADGQRLYQRRHRDRLLRHRTGKGARQPADAVQPARRIGALAVRRDPEPSLPGHRGQHRLHQKPLLRKPGFQLSEHGDRRRRPVHPEDRDVRQRKRRHESGRDDASGSFRRTGLVARGTAVLRLFVPVLSRPRQAVGTYGALEPPAVLRAIGNGRSAASPASDRRSALAGAHTAAAVGAEDPPYRPQGRRAGTGMGLHSARFWAPIGEFALALGNRIRPNRKIWR